MEVEESRDRPRPAILLLEQSSTSHCSVPAGSKGRENLEFESAKSSFSKGLRSSFGFCENVKRSTFWAPKSSFGIRKSILSYLEWSGISKTLVWETFRKLKIFDPCDPSCGQRCQCFWVRRQRPELILRLIRALRSSLKNWETAEKHEA